jgi:molybdate-binding protein
MVLNDMPEVGFVKSIEQIRVLADTRRLAVIRLLMVKPATLTQLGDLLGEHPAWVRHHLKLLEQAGLVEMCDIQFKGGYVEKYYKAKAQAFVFHQMILPEVSGSQMVVFLGSHDLALNLLVQHIHEVDNQPVLVLPVGSLEGLIALRQGLAHMTGCHLLDSESLEYNLPYVRHFFPDRPIVLVTLAYREQGLMVLPGNPLQIRGLEDLVREDVSIVNRNKGSGTRLWLDNQLRSLGFPDSHIRGYTHEVYTHTAVAQAIVDGKASVGLGLAAAARQAELDFIPLFQERYDLVFPAEQYEDQRFQPMINYLHSRKFRQAVQDLGGYSTQETGREIKL